MFIVFLLVFAAAKLSTTISLPKPTTQTIINVTGAGIIGGCVWQIYKQNKRITSNDKIIAELKTKDLEKEDLLSAYIAVTLNIKNTVNDLAKKQEELELQLNTYVAKHHQTQGFCKTSVPKVVYKLSTTPWH